MNTDIKIIIAAHKKYYMPEDDMYIPVQVGAAGKDSIGYARDDDGENISEKNRNYCELTGLYWAWKNTSSDYLGLAHYRRHFATKGVGKKIVDRQYLENKVLRGEESVHIVLPRRRNYFIETNYSQYVHAHHAEDLDITREIIADKHPEYLDTYDKVMGDTKGHRFNMFIMERKYADAYCHWLFDILSELEAKLDISGYSANDQRVFGFVSERLLDVWIGKNGYTYKELPVIFMEKQNWPKKILAFLRRKFGWKRLQQL